MFRRFLSASLIILFLSLTIGLPHTFAASLSAGNAAQLITAIIAANNTPQADTILLTGNITLTSAYERDFLLGYTGLPAIATDITIEGQGFTITRSASAVDEFRILRVSPAGNLTLLNLTVSEGRANYTWDDTCIGGACGGGVYNEGTLTIVHCHFLNNRANYYGFGGSLVNRGTTSISDSTLEAGWAGSRGGGISNVGVLTVQDSVILNNATAGYGGGLHNLRPTGIATIVNTTFMGNHAEFSGGGIQSEGANLTINASTFNGNTAGLEGGAIMHEAGYTDPMLVTNSTFANNQDSVNEVGGGGAITVQSSPATIQNSTFYGNSSTLAGALYLEMTTRVDNSLVVNNPGLWQCSSGIYFGGFNQSSDITCNPAPVFTTSSMINLAPLGDNGGATQTFDLNTGSSALDAADNTQCSAYDQRGVRRGIDADGTANSPQAGDCDAGAVESDGIIRTVQFAADSSAGAPFAGMVSIPLTLDAPLPNGYAPVTVYVWVSGGTAVAGTDYAPFGVQTATFNPGDTTANVTLNVLRPLTSSRTVVLSIAAQNGPGFSGPAVLAGQTTHVLTLTTMDDSAPPRNYFTTHTPTLTWSLINGAAGYEIQVDTNKAFTSSPYPFQETGIPPDRLYATPTLAKGTYYWRVRAKDSTGKPGAWSATETFVIGT